MDTNSSSLSSDFLTAFALVVGSEGGYVNDPDDPGGETKYGISKRAYPTLDIKNLTLDDARAIYWRDYWLADGCDKQPWSMAFPMFDTAVNSGVGTAKALLASLTETKNPERQAEYLALRALRNTHSPKFEKYGKGWFKREFLVMARSLSPPSAA